jgi:hypothetical protein
MKVAVVGSRDFTERQRLYSKLDRLQAKRQITLVISGGARGVDTFAVDWAKSRGIPWDIKWPDWNTHGKKAGFLRNAQIIDEADICIAFWDNVSKGTAHSIGLAKKKGIPVKIFRILPITYK